MRGKVYGDLLPVVDRAVNDGSLAGLLRERGEADCEQDDGDDALKDLPLTSLDLDAWTQLRDLEPLKGMPLTSLICHYCPLVRDLTPLNGMPLKKLAIDGTTVTDLRPLQAMPLEDIRLTPKNITQGLDILRNMKSLKIVGIHAYVTWPAAEFWDRYEKGEFKK